MLLLMSMSHLIPSLKCHIFLFINLPTIFFAKSKGTGQLSIKQPLNNCWTTLNNFF